MKKDFYQLHLAFQNFMVEKGYSVRQRESLLSPLFPTTFTMSGGPDLAYKFWKGDETLCGNHIVNQPCIRHWDIEATGDGKHLSFFNMFVADSIEGFSRKEVLSHFFEFFIVHLGLDPKRFFASYFSGGNIKGVKFEPDQEARDIWLSMGIEPSRIVPFGLTLGMEAFVANSVEPVGGPRSELFYDLRERSTPFSSTEEFMEQEKQGLLLEFFTHVLYEYEVTKNADEAQSHFYFQKMNRAAVAAGFGPQRLLKITEAVEDIGEISVFQSLNRHFSHLPPEYHKQSTIVSDHIRGLVFLIHDGILNAKGSKNRSRQYLFRKYFRHFKQNFEQLALEDGATILGQITNNSIDLFSILFPDFEGQRKNIVSEVKRLYQKDESVHTVTSR